MNQSNNALRNQPNNNAQLNQQINKAYIEQVKPGPQSFITQFDVTIQNEIKGLTQNRNVTIKDFLKNSGLLAKGVNPEIIVKECWKKTTEVGEGNATAVESQVDSEWEKGRVKFPISEFINEGLFVNGRLFSAAESGSGSYPKVKIPLGRTKICRLNPNP